MLSGKSMSGWNREHSVRLRRARPELGETAEGGAHAGRAPTRIRWISILLVLGSVFAAGSGFAQLRVSAIDWVQGRSEIPHPAINGKTTILQAIAEGGNCNGNYTYRWDWNGDGDFDDGGEGWHQANSAEHRAGYFAPLGLEVQFPDQPGDRLFFPKVEVECAGQRESTTMPVLVRVERVCDGYPANINGRCEGDQNIELTRQIHHDRVVDRALWWMFNRISHFGDDGQRGGIHSCVFWGSPAQYGQGHMLNAFLRRSHGYGPGRASDAYYRHAVDCGLNALVGTYSMTGGMWFDDDGSRGWDGWRMQYTNGRLGGSSHWSSYGSTAWVEPVANFGSARYRVPGGEDRVRGRELQDLGGDLADGLVYCMSASGQWYYSCRNDGHPDASTNGWAPEALRLLERKFGTNTYSWARDTQRGWLNRHCSDNSNNDHRLFGCNYHIEWNYNGGVGKLAGNALVGYGWTQYQDFNDNRGDAVWRMREHWRAATRLDHNWWGLYYMYATTKGMRSFVPEQRYFEDGRDWSTEFAHFLLSISESDQYWRWCSNGDGRQCHWHWKDNFNVDTSTAISTQIVQTWLETQAMARATPQNTGPGIDITFDHSWSHILDPNVTLTRYRWNVRDEPEDDVNGDGVVSTDEMVWEFETDDPNETYLYRYDEDLGWDDVQNFKVTLEVTDSQGRTNYDDKSVQITLSLKNHPPVVIGHPDGINGYYTGYVGQAIMLDPRATNDVDAEHEVFPGEGDRPRGIPDRITSICYDVDLDGRWCEPGEDATAGPLEFTPNEGMQVGDRIGIPIRACDDGRWNGKCYQPGDGGPPHLTRADCTDCAYGSVGLELVVNAAPPEIRSAEDVYTVTPGESVQLDFSGSSDPEGVLGDGSAVNGVRFTYRLTQGGGRIEPTEGFQNANDLGPRPVFHPDGDGAEDVTLEVTATDAGDLSSRAQYTIRVANVPPVLDAWNVRFEPRPPVIADEVRMENLGNRRYRVTVVAEPDPGWDGYIDYETTEPYNEPVTITADFDGDGVVDLQSQERDSTVGPYTYEVAGVQTPVILAVSDGEDTVTEQRNVGIPDLPPNVEREMRYSLDIGNDGVYEMAGSDRSSLVFMAPRGANEIAIAGRVDGNGFSVPFNAGSVTLPNGDPTLSGVRVVSQDGFNVVLMASATDPDSDPLTYFINWGDGSPPLRTATVVSRHSYPRGQYRDYQVEIIVRDGRGGEDSARVTVSIEEPIVVQANLEALAWTKVTPTEGNYDGFRSLAIGRDGTIFAHNYLDEIRRSVDGGDNWDVVLADVECCGSIATRQAGEVVVASPSGLYFSNDNGDNWALWDEQKYQTVSVSPNGDFVVAGSDSQLRRFDWTGRLTDTFDVNGDIVDAETCATGNRAAFSTNQGQLFTNDDPSLAPDGWAIPEARFSKGSTESSVSFDPSCNLYQGLWNGFRIWKYPNGPVVPSTQKAPKHMIHPAGHHAAHIHRGTALINDIIAFEDGPFIIGATRGIFGSETPRNAYRAPYWGTYNVGISRSTIARRFAVHPSTGHVFLATSAAAQVPKYCRQRIRGNRRNHRFRRRRAGRRLQFFYTFCGFDFRYYGGIYRSSQPILNSKTFGNGGAEFNVLNARGTRLSQDDGGLIVDLQEQGSGHLWLPDTANSALSRWDTSGRDPVNVGTYRVGLPAGECPNTCCWDNGCNMPSRVAVDDAGNAYVATLGFGISGTVTKVAGNRAQCVDRNNDGEIQTSVDETPLGFGEDECVVWTVRVGGNNALLRSLSVDIGDANRPNGYVWVGAYNENRVYKLDPDTGAILDTVDLDVSPFGSVIGSSGTLWVSTLGDGALQPVNSANGQVGQVVTNPAELRDGCRNSYGVTMDQVGRIWMSGWECNDAIAYDPASGQWCQARIPGERTVGRGITVDNQNRVWTTLGGDQQSGFAWWDANQCEGGEAFNVVNFRNNSNNTRGATAIGADRDGRIWIFHYLSPIMVQVDTVGGVFINEWESHDRVYSFSDFSGMVRQNAIGRGYYTEDVEASCANPTWTVLDWDAQTPESSTVSFLISTAADRDKLVDAAILQAAQAPADGREVNIGDVFDAANVTQRRFLRIKVSMQRAANGLSPVLERFSVLWSCD